MEYYTDKQGKIYCYDSYRLRELGLPRDMRPSTEQEITMFNLVRNYKDLEKLVHEIADVVGIEWRQ